MPTNVVLYLHDMEKRVAKMNVLYLITGHLSFLDKLHLNAE